MENRCKRIFEKTADQLDDVNVTSHDEDAYLAKINPVIDAFNERIATLQKQASSDDEEEIFLYQLKKQQLNRRTLINSYDAILEELATEIRQIDKTFHDNQQVWEEMRVYAVEREMAKNDPLSHLKLYENMTLARIHSLISRYHTY